MKMGRLIVVLSLVVVGGCWGGKAESEKQVSGTDKGALEQKEVPKVIEWKADGTGKNPTLAVTKGQTVFVFDKQKRMRARIHIEHDQKTIEVPLVQLEIGGELLYYGSTERDTWVEKVQGNITIQCVRCSQEFKPRFREPCCI